MYHLYVCVYFPHNDQLGRTYFPHNALYPQCIICTYMCTFPTTTNSDARIFPTMHFSHNVSLVRMCVRSPQQPTRTHGFSRQCTFPTIHFPHNVSFVRMCVRSPQRPTRTHGFSPQCTFPTMYRWYVCVYVPHNDQLGRTHFPHNAQCIVGTYVCVCREAGGRLLP